MASNSIERINDSGSRGSILNEKQAQKIASQFKSVNNHDGSSLTGRPSSILGSLLQRPIHQQHQNPNNQVSDSFNIYNKKGNNMGSSRRQTTANKSKNGLVDKKPPNTTRNESSKSTPSNPLLKAKVNGSNGKNMQSTGNIMTTNQGIFARGGDRYLPLSS